MPRHEQELLARYGREPMAIALEHAERWPRRADASDETKARARAMVGAALRSQSLDGVECVWTRLTCGYFKRADGLAIVPVWGDLGPMRAFWPWVWYEDLAGVADDAAKDGDVKAVLFHFDSPGGYVTGNAECARAIEAAAGTKPCAAYANDYMTSAAYWLGAATGRVSAPATGVVGSIGALCVHGEISRALDDMGVTVRVVRSKPRKAETNQFEPLTAAALGQLQTEIAACDAPFDEAIARLRGVDRLAIQATQGACLTADAALAGRFADAVETFDSACAALIARTAKPAPASASPASAGAAGPSRRAAAPRAVGGPATSLGASAFAKATADRSAISKHPARGKAAQTKPPRPRATAKTRSQSMDPTTLTPEEQIKRYDEIAAILAEEPADDNAKIGQFVQVAGIVNRPAEEEAPAEEQEEAPAEEPAAARAKANPHAGAIAASKEGQANPAAALQAIGAGLSLAQFKAMAPSLAKGKTLGARMEAEASARRLNADAPAAGATGGNVTALSPQSIYDRRRKQAAGAKS